MIAALCALAALAVAAPGKEKGRGAVRLAYEYEKGLSYVDEARAAITLDMFVKGQHIAFEVENRKALKRTVLEVGDDGRPVIERVEVQRFVHEVKKHPREDVGERRAPSQGRTFVWRRKPRGDEWALYDGKGDVTAKHPQLVAKLRNWREARLPEEPVAPGDTWEVSAASFLRAVGQPVPEGVTGKATFTLDRIRDGIAHISFRFENTYRDGESVLQGWNKGVWRFDVERGRDLSLRMKGRLEIDGGDGGSGRFEMTREVTYGGAPRTRGDS